MSGGQIVVFVGPSLSTAQAKALLDASYEPPAARGDVYRASLRRPWGIAIIDGYFERVPAVWHKEILWALSQGIHVFGAASMGALRAAELAAFGMQGVGEIFEAYRTGAWLDDDEVTIVHADGSYDYRPLSVAMCDMRATFALARARQVLSEQQEQLLVELAKGMHYAERSYHALWRAGAVQALGASRIAQLCAWVEQHQVSQKALDARALLLHVAELQRTQPGPRPASFVFEHTDAFEQLVQLERTRAGSRAEEPLSAVLDELRLDPELYMTVAERAFANLLVAREVERTGTTADDAAYAREVHAFRRAHGLWDAETTQTFLAQQQLSRDELAQLMRQRARAKALHAALSPSLERGMLELLQLDGRYAQLAAAAQHKREQLTKRGVGQLAHALDDAALVRWYSERLWSRATAHGRGLEPQQLLEGLGFKDSYALLAAARREYLYCSSEASCTFKGDDDEEDSVHR